MVTVTVICFVSLLMEFPLKKCDKDMLPKEVKKMDKTEKKDGTAKPVAKPKKVLPSKKTKGK